MMVEQTPLGMLRAIDSTELELMLAWRNAPSVRANMYTRHEISLDEHLAWWNRIQARADQQYFMYEHDGTPCGIVAFVDMDRVNSNSSWAFYASPEAPRGTGSKMEFLALDYVFQQEKLHKLSCEVLAFNHPVIKLHQKFGFKVEGILRHQHNVDGEYIDIYRLGILDSEWGEKREEMIKKLIKHTNN